MDTKTVRLLLRMTSARVQEAITYVREDPTVAEGKLLEITSILKDIEQELKEG